MSFSSFSAVQAVIKDAPDLAIGNALGSSFFNALVAAPIALVLDPGGQLHGVSFTSLFAVACAVILYLMMWSGHRLSRSEGLALVALYVVFVGYSLIS
jgi:cation:H+ antiporter